MRQHFLKHWNIYITGLLMILIPALNFTLQYSLIALGVPHIVCNAIALILMLWIHVHLIQLRKVDDVSVQKLVFDRKWLQILLIVINTGFILELVLSSTSYTKTNSVTSMAFAFYIGYFLALGINKIVKYTINKKRHHDDIVPKELYDKLIDYMQRYNVFFVGEYGEREIYSINVKIPAKHSEEILEFFKFFMSNPQLSYIVAKIFKNHIDFKNDCIYIDGEIETNPSKVGLYIFNKLSTYSKTELKLSLDLY